MAMSRQRPLTAEEQHELATLNTAVTRAIEDRREWLDAKMVETSSLQVGDGIYDLRTGSRLGVVTGLYRFWRDRDDGIRDDSHYCDYRYKTSLRGFDNTSRQTARSYGTKEDALRYAEMQVSRLAKEVTSHDEE